MHTELFSAGTLWRLGFAFKSRAGEELVAGGGTRVALSWWRLKLGSEVVGVIRCTIVSTSVRVRFSAEKL